MMDVAVPANMRIGLRQEDLVRKGRAVSVTEALALVDRSDVAIVDLREPAERDKQGIIRGSLHTPNSSLQHETHPGGILHELAVATGKRILFYCAFGERLTAASQLQ